MNKIKTGDTVKVIAGKDKDREEDNLVWTCSR